MIVIGVKVPASCGVCGRGSGRQSYCVIQDYYNLVDVYLDAVLYPNCVQDPKTFAQEGWHYELENPEVREPCAQVLLLMNCIS